MAILVRAEQLTKTFRAGNTELIVLDSLDFAVEAGEMIAIVGESGSGKSTLLHLLGALDKPTRVRYTLMGGCIQASPRPRRIPCGTGNLASCGRCIACSRSLRLGRM